MQQAHLTAWQVRAPWPKRSQIEQDLRLSRGVAAIFSDPVLSDHLAMRGGTVLHKAHLAPASRYSEDVDLVLVKAIGTEELDTRLRQVLSPVLGTPTDSLIAAAWLTLRNVLRPSKTLRTVHKFVPLNLRREEAVKVEVNLNEGDAALEAWPRWDCKKRRAARHADPRCLKFLPERRRDSWPPAWASTTRPFRTASAGGGPRKRGTSRSVSADSARLDPALTPPRR